MKKIIVLLLISCFSFSSCEKDDICDGNTLTTPRLVITFYDINNSSTEKSVTNLSIIANGMEDGITYEGSTLINGSTVAIPLKTDLDTTTFRFILNFGSSNTALVNEDIIEFNYGRENIFVSRACGFKTNFILNTTDPIVHTDAPTADLKWIQYYEVENRTIANENETHLKIYF
ncbi:hypothetical protein GCM10008015_31160 [Flavobacterium palustre]|uniref:Lipoprotein n=1 Tax=Flavobacterium palustre TaxID=1476463 RepID=A0ABQ1HT47_9FLAO|nr:DUF6452 family protein [Flavobacterium palustre]GGA88344.1 hypothetical protein GCM10008015_31160 [Flavobacterium palustre]